MQDNAPIHTANRVKEQLEENGINTSDWPLYSPDLNPIEHTQKKLKEVVIEEFPEVQDAKGESEVDLKNIEEALKKAWLLIPTSFFESLVESMSRRVQAVIKAEGWHTKYQGFGQVYQKGDWTSEFVRFRASICVIQIVIIGCGCRFISV